MTIETFDGIDNLGMFIFDENGKSVHKNENEVEYKRIVEARRKQEEEAETTGIQVSLNYYLYCPYCEEFMDEDDFMEGFYDILSDVGWNKKFIKEEVECKHCKKMFYVDIFNN